MNFDEIWESNDSRALIQKEEGKVLFDIACTLPEGSLIVEVGSFEGKSSSVLASVADAKNLRLICVDPLVDFKNDGVPVTSETREIFIKSIVNVFKNVKWIDKPTITAVDDVNEPIDFIFIDGDHTYNGVMIDCKLWLPKLKSGHLVTLHDYNNIHFWGVEKAFKEYAPDWEEVNSVWNLRTFKKP